MMCQHAPLLTFNCFQVRKVMWQCFWDKPHLWGISWVAIWFWQMLDGRCSLRWGPVAVTPLLNFGVCRFGGYYQLRSSHPLRSISSCRQMQQMLGKQYMMSMFSDLIWPVDAMLIVTPAVSWRHVCVHTALSTSRIEEDKLKSSAQFAPHNSLHTHAWTQTHTYMHAHTHTDPHRYTRPHTQRNTCMHTPTHTHTDAHRRAHACRHPHRHTHKHAQIHTVAHRHVELVVVFLVVVQVTSSCCLGARKDTGDGGLPWVKWLGWRSAPLNWFWVCLSGRRPQGRPGRS